METVYDWVTVGIFAGLIVLFLHRSTSEESSDSILQYLLPSLGCAVSNYFGTDGNHVIAVAIIAATLGYIFVVLKPFRSQAQP